MLGDVEQRSSTTPVEAMYSLQVLVELAVFGRAYVRRSHAQQPHTRPQPLNGALHAGNIISNSNLTLSPLRFLPAFSPRDKNGQQRARTMWGCERTRWLDMMYIVPLGNHIRSRRAEVHSWHSNGRHGSRMMRDMRYISVSAAFLEA